jgi:hypothetical protein
MENQNNDNKFGKFIKNIFYILAIIIVILLFVYLNKSGSNSGGSRYSGSYDSYEDTESLDMYDAKDDHWDEISEYLNGTYTIEACSYDSDNCYDLEAEINSGSIGMIYFSNGGYLDIYGADVDSEGGASGDSDNGGWSFQVDDTDIDDAIIEWADIQDIELEY